MSARAASALVAAAAALLGAATARADDPSWRPASASDAAPAPARGDRLGWYVPDYARVGSGGYLGAAVAGVGYDLYRDVINAGVSYGYAPPRGGAPAYHSLSAHLALRPLHLRLHRDVELVPIYVGGGFLRAFGPNLFVHQPPVYPSNYYEPNALHPTAFAGAELNLLTPRSLVRRHGVYYEATTIGQYLYAFVRNDDLRLYDAFSSFVGYRASF
ncbi:MAG TPA: hypothetical protein VFS43_24910 [Polyangiaceae bacterium]|nr:hypothetical protein [Polyangiaceae bacterium]